MCVENEEGGGSEFVCILDAILEFLVEIFVSSSMRIDGLGSLELPIFLMHARLDTWLLLPFFLSGWLAVVELLYVCVVFLTIIIFLNFFLRNCSACKEKCNILHSGLRLR